MSLESLVASGAEVSIRGKLSQLYLTLRRNLSAADLRSVVEWFLGRLNNPTAQDAADVGTLVAQQDRAVRAGRQFQRDQAIVPAVIPPTEGAKTIIQPADFVTRIIVEIIDPRTGQKHRQPYEYPTVSVPVWDDMIAAVHEEVGRLRPWGPPPPQWVGGGPLEVGNIVVISVEKRGK